MTAALCVSIMTLSNMCGRIGFGFIYDVLKGWNSLILLMIINGISTKKYKDRDWDSYRNHTIGFVFQSYNLIPHQTVLANVELALTISGVSKEVRRPLGGVRAYGADDLRVEIL